MRNPLLALMLALALAPLAAAQENTTSERPADAAWVEDCPPDMMCAMQEPSDEPTYDDQSGTCMDGQQEGETCRDDVHYMDAPARGPADGSCEDCRGGTAEAEPIRAPAEAETTSASGDARDANVPAPTLALVIGAFAAVALLALPRRP